MRLCVQRRSGLPGGVHQSGPAHRPAGGVDEHRHRQSHAGKTLRKFNTIDRKQKQSPADVGLEVRLRRHYSWQGQLRDLKGGAVFSFHSVLELLLQLEALLEQ